MYENEGFIKLFRKIQKWGWYTDIPVKCLFLHLLLTASYRDFEWQGKQFRAGQIITGREKLARDLNLSESQIRTAISKLKSTGEITVKSTNKYSVITIVKWQDYQQNDETSNRKSANKSPTDSRQIANKSPHNKNIKNKKNVNNYSARRREREQIQKMANARRIEHKSVLECLFLLILHRISRIYASIIRKILFV